MLKVGEQIRRTLSSVLQRGEVHDPDLNRMMITVGEVRMSPDLRVATAYILPLGGKNKEEALDAMRRNRHEIRHLVVKGGSQKFAPELRFEIDGTFDQMDATRALLADDHDQQDRYTVCTVDAASEDLRLFHSDAAGDVIGDFRRLDAQYPDQTLTFAMNAGMYHDDRAPVGLYQEAGRAVSGIVTSDGPGNFGLLPNGVLCLTDTSAQVFESLAFVASQPDCRDANQSGPMLVIDGALHPRFLVDGTSKYIRNGVGTTADGRTAVFAISNNPVNFHSFGSLFRDYLKTPNALYFDGKVSRLFAPQLNT